MFANLHSFMLFRINFDVFRRVATVRFFHGALYHCHSKFTGVDRRFKLGKQMPCRADVVKVTVSKDNSFYFVLIFFKIGNVWHDVIDAGIAFAREQEAHIDNNDFVAVFDSHHVFTNAHFA